jgi:hypothetical protein
MKEFDIRMIYDGTGCGLNAAVWAPSFWMPTASTALRRVSFYSHCVDGDLGEMFLNSRYHSDRSEIHRRPMGQSLQDRQGIAERFQYREQRNQHLPNKRKKDDHV